MTHFSRKYLPKNKSKLVWKPIIRSAFEDQILSRDVLDALVIFIGYEILTRLPLLSRRIKKICESIPKIPIIDIPISFGAPCMTPQDWKKLDFKEEYKNLSGLTYHEFIKKDHEQVETLLGVIYSITKNEKYDKVTFNVTLNQFDTFNYGAPYFEDLLLLFDIIGESTVTLKFSLSHVPDCGDLHTLFPNV